MSTQHGVARWIFFVAICLSLVVAAASYGQAPEPKRTAWTVEEALERLRWYPRDSYLQYVALQLARREDRLTAVGAEVERITRGGRTPFGNERVAQVDLFSIFSGALAIQESLQLDTMRDASTGAAADKADSGTVNVSSLTGPTIKSHPWETMLAGKRPELSPLARCVPADFYFIEFRSLGKLLDVMDTSDLWTRHLFAQAKQEARTQLVGQRLQRQLALETNFVLRPFYDAVVSEVAITGSDLFVREGSDVTLLFRFKSADVFKKQMDVFLSNAEQEHANARRNQGEVLGVPFVHVSTPDRALSVFAAYPEPDLHVRCNSRIALERVIAAIQGKDAKGQAVQRLGDATEFAYIRSLMPRGAAEEDGFVYLSDPFIRRLVGPELKLTMRRRMLCYNHLRMIGHAAMLYRTEQGRPPRSLEELEQAKCTPGEFNAPSLACPDGGRYELSADGLGGRCTHHGNSQWLTPCCEIPVEMVTAGEAAEYKQFLTRYNQYWRTFFDPIAIRIQMTPQRYRVETIILPLIDNSIYSGLAAFTGGASEPLETLPVPKRNIFSLALHLNKAELVRRAGFQDLLVDQDPRLAGTVEPDTDKINLNMRMIGLAFHNYHDVHKGFPFLAEFDDTGARNRLSWRVHLLPFFDQLELYEQFKLDEPWDSEHNKKLIPRMPAIYASANSNLKSQGKTKFVVPTGDKTIVTGHKKSVRLEDFRDGTSNTILLLESDDAHAVIWTKPEDLPVNLDEPMAGIAQRKPGGFLALIADGSTDFLRTSIDKKKLAALLTPAGGETFENLEADQIPLASNSHQRSPYGLDVDVLRELNVGELLTRGIGDHIGFHVYDAEPMFAFSLPSFLGMSLGSFQNRGFRWNDEFLLISVLISSLNAPVYVSIPVRDASIVDLFLGRLEGYLAKATRADEWSNDFFGVRTESYRLHLQDNQPAQGFVFEFGPVKWRFFWARIGNGLYIASQPYVLEDLNGMQNGEKSSEPSANKVAANALVHLRPPHWQRVLSGYKLGWAENNRRACMQNLGLLSNVGRSISAEESAGEQRTHELHRLAAQLYDARFFCPDGGQYHLGKDGKQVTCNVHGSAELPLQKMVPADNSDLGKLLRQFSDMTLALTFLEDGLHAVITIDRNNIDRK